MPSQPDYSRVSLNDDNGFHNNNNNGMGTTHALMQQQDEGLEMLGQSAVRLGEMSLQISDELTSQNTMLQDMDEQLDNAQNELDVVTRKTKEFIQAAGGTQNCVVIATLSVLVVVLVFLILYF